MPRRAAKNDMCACAGESGGAKCSARREPRDMRGKRLFTPPFLHPPRLLFTRATPMLMKPFVRTASSSVFFADSFAHDFLSGEFAIAAYSAALFFFFFFFFFFMLNEPQNVRCAPQPRRRAQRPPGQRMRRGMLICRYRGTTATPLIRRHRPHASRRSCREPNKPLYASDAAPRACFAGTRSPVLAR